MFLQFYIDKKNIMKPLTFTILLFVLSNICYSQVIINEIQSSNTSTITDNYGQYEDWIEILNPTDTSVDIGGMVLKDNVDTWQIPIGDTNTIIAAKGFFLLWADDEEFQGKFHTNFKLSAANGEFLGLFQSDSITVIDTVNFPPLSNNQSYGRCDLQDWTVFNNATPLSLNDCLNTGFNNLNNKGLIIYPLTTKGAVNIDLPKYNGEKIKVFLYSTEGKLMMDKNYSNKTFTFDLSNLKRGIYIINIYIGEVCYTEKIFKE